MVNTFMSHMACESRTLNLFVDLYHSRVFTNHILFSVRFPFDPELMAVYVWYIVEIVSVIFHLFLLSDPYWAVQASAAGVRPRAYGHALLFFFFLDYLCGCCFPFEICPLSHSFFSPYRLRLVTTCLLFVLTPSHSCAYSFQSALRLFLQSVISAV